MRLLIILAIMSSFLLPAVIHGDEKYPYSQQCAKYRLKRSHAKLEDAAQGIADREQYENKGMELHEKGQWEDSNCFLIHATNISSDHAVNLINTIGLNYAALGDDKQALNYFEDATAYAFDLDIWLQHKAKPPFNKILNKPVYKVHEKSLYNYYKEMGLEIPKY